VTTTSLAFTHERVPDIQPLPDILLDNINYQSWGLDVSEICIMIIVWTAFLLVLFHKHRFEYNLTSKQMNNFEWRNFCSRCIVLRRIFLLLGLHYTYRAITMYLTVLPKPNLEYTWYVWYILKRCMSFSLIHFSQRHFPEIKSAQ